MSLNIMTPLGTVTFAVIAHNVILEAQRYSLEETRPVPFLPPGMSVDSVSGVFLTIHAGTLSAGTQNQPLVGGIKNSKPAILR